MTNARFRSGYKLAKTVHIGGEGGWDLLEIDNIARRLFVSHSTKVHVFDVDTLTPVGEVLNTRGVHGIAIAREFGRGFTSNGQSATVSIFDLKTLKVVNEIVVIDSLKLEILSKWSISPGESPTGIALDFKNRRLFSTGRNNLIMVLDADSGRIVASLPIGSRPDGCSFDPQTRLAFSSNGDGTLTIIREGSPTAFSVIDNVPTQTGSRTIVLDLKTHSVFLPAAEFGPAPQPTAEQPRPRPRVLPGTFSLLRFDKEP